VIRRFDSSRQHQVLVCAPFSFIPLLFVRNSRMILFMKPEKRQTLAEIALFTKRAEALCSEVEIDSLKDYLSLNPLSGDEMPGTGGLRKLRWSRSGMGKRGGVRVIYYFYNENFPVYLLTLYAKSTQEDLTPKDKKSLIHIAQQIKAKCKE
jgi:mRNA-degrading endonuclease RelE of RelBE toxin-antitoxin system